VSTATDASVDELNALLYGEEALENQACETAQPRCDREAVFEIRWRADGRPKPEDRCGCARVTLQCLEHGESYMGLEAKPLMVQCHRCGGFMVPFHIDKLRRG
jgi:hypothetical protein